MRRPASTYRLQLNADFGFAQARAVVDYLDRLGVGDAYLSPIFRARPGSTHGYDAVDPREISPALGGRAGLERLHQTLEQHDMGLLLDIVPNHMAAHHENAWWWDVLKHGAGSRYARFFDIDWGDGGRVLLPVLGRPLERVLEDGELELDTSGDEPVLRYYEHRFPLAPGSAVEDADGAPSAALLDEQHYQLAHWRRAATDINYRRFFDISDLVALRMERPEVFDATHGLIMELVLGGTVTGLRVDHVDGLREPADYLLRVQERVFGGRHRYLVVEKILEADEELPGDWPVEGTTGYDFLNTVNGLFVARRGVDELSRVYAAFTGITASFHDVVFDRKLQVQDELFGAELGRLARTAAVLCDQPVDRVRPALAATTAALARYRTYFSRDRLREEDRRLVRHAVAEAQRRRPQLDGAALAGLEKLLTLHGHSPPDVPPDALDLVMRWQQYSGPVMAKGHEDTALYVYNRLLSANAVGSDPDDPASSVTEFHRLCRQRVRQPGAMNATSTHDSKRSEDVRARIDVLSEMPDAWRQAVQQWRELNGPLARDAGGTRVPNPNLEMLAYQTLVGAWPLDRQEEPEFTNRFADYLLKAAREAKVFTSWIEQDPAYEEALQQWARAILQPGHDFVDVLRTFCEPVAFLGALGSLSQTVLKISAPGVPDLYQGTELWDYSLVDPDNRRPVDYDHRRALLDGLESTLAAPSSAGARALWQDWRSGRAKLYVTAALLRDRRGQPDLYRGGDHVPLEREGGAAAHVCAFLRRRGRDWRLIAVPLRLAGRAERAAPPWPAGADVWADTRLLLPAEAPRRWCDRLSGASHEVPDGALLAARLFADFPVSVLEGESA